MEAYLDKIGLIIVALSWVVQLSSIVRKKSTKLNIFFIILNLIGTVIITYDQFMMGLRELSLINLINIICLIFISILLMKKK